MSIEAEAEAILTTLSSMSFEKCCPLSRKFESIPTNPGIYAVRHRLDGILYIGKTINLKRRFCDGHKALSWAFIARYDPDDVRIAIMLYGQDSWRRAGEIEALMIYTAQPSYNDLMK